MQIGKEVVIPADVVQAVVNYLQTKPFVEVNQLLNLIMAADRDTQERKAKDAVPQAVAAGPKLLDGKFPDGV